MNHRCISLLVPGAVLALALSSTALHAQSTPAGSTAPDATQAQDSSPEIAALQRVTDQWDDAVQQHDAYALDLVLSPKMTDISADGQLRSRDQLVSSLTQKNSPVRTLGQKVTQARILGDMAIVNGIYGIKFRQDDEGRNLPDERGVYTQVFERLQNQWICINSQRTLVPAPRADKKKKEARNDTKFLHLLPGL
jgi:hypothetical protein